MNGSVRRAICAVAGSLALAGAAHAAAPVLTAFDGNAVFDPGQVASRQIDLGHPFALPELPYGPPSAQLSVANVATSVSLVTGLDLELGYKVDLTGRVTPYDASNTHAFDGLFFSSAATGSQYDSLAGGGNFIGVTAALADDLHLTAGGASLAPGFVNFEPNATAALARTGGADSAFGLRSATSLLGGLTWDITKWAGIGLNAAQTSEQNGVLGTQAAGFNANTMSGGVSARMSLGGGWVTTASYSEGITQLDLRHGLTAASLLPADDLHTRSYGIAIAKNGLFGDDALGLAVSRPAFGDGGNFITMPGGNQGQPQFFTRSNLLAGTTPETDLEIGYVTTFLDGAVALQTNASYQMNFAGQNGNNAISLLSRARIKF